MKTIILRVSDQNGVSLLYIMLVIHYSGRKPSICVWFFIRQARILQFIINLEHFSFEEDYVFICPVMLLLFCFVLFCIVLLCCVSSFSVYHHMISVCY